MNDSLCMYTLKPLIHFQDTVIDCIPSMYRMKNINCSNFRTSQVKDDAAPRNLPNVLEQVNELLKKPTSDVEVLRKQQESILTQLNQLKYQMLSLRDELSKKDPVNPTDQTQTHKSNTSHHQVVMSELKWDGVMDEIVVFASPERPPYSLLAVNNLWPEVLRLKVSCHTHSSVSSLPSHLEAFSALSVNSSPNLNIRLIWKHMESDCESIFSPLINSPIRGEVNLLRYLHRNIHPSNDLVSEVKQDNILDLCHRLNHARTMQDKKMLVRMLNAKLGKACWLGGDRMTVADVAAWSSLRSLSGVDFTQNMTKWHTRCSDVAGIKAVQ